MYCNHCGKEIQDEVKFCGHCGNTVQGGTAIPTANTSTAPINTPSTIDSLLMQLQKADALLRQREAITKDLTACRAKKQAVEEKSKAIADYGRSIKLAALALPAFLGVAFSLGTTSNILVCLVLGVGLGLFFMLATAYCIKTLEVFEPKRNQAKQQSNEYLAVELPRLEENEAVILANLHTLDNNPANIHVLAFLPEPYRELAAINFIRKMLAEKKADSLLMACELYNQDKSYTGPRCPDCGSRELHTTQEISSSSSGGGYGCLKGVCGLAFFGPLGLLCGNLGHSSHSTTYSTNYWICKQCGKKFKQ